MHCFISSTHKKIVQGRNYFCTSYSPTTATTQKAFSNNPAFKTGHGDAGWSYINGVLGGMKSKPNIEAIQASNMFS